MPLLYLLCAALVATADGSVSSSIPQVDVKFVVTWNSATYKYDVDGISVPALWVTPGLVHKFETVDLPELHPLYLSNSAGGGDPSAAFGATDRGYRCQCPGGNSVAGTGAIYFMPTNRTPASFSYGCELHSGLGAAIGLRSGAASTQATAAAMAWSSGGSSTCSWCGAAGYSTTAAATVGRTDRSLIHAHAACMLAAFGIMLPAGAFLAHTGYHRLHIFVQPAAVLESSQSCTERFERRCLKSDL